jgi:hypothetical protein
MDKVQKHNSFNIKMDVRKIGGVEPSGSATSMLVK